MFINSMKNIILNLNNLSNYLKLSQSSLIQLILRELPLSEGTMNIQGVVSYASQQPWLFTGSIEQNILFGSPKDEERYREVHFRQSL